MRFLVVLFVMAGFCLMKRKSRTRQTKLPEFFRWLLWSYKFSQIDADEDKERIIINTINYGDWEHWRWVVNYYGTKEVKKIIENTSASEFRKRSLELISLLLGIKKLKYVSRGAKIRAEKNIH